MGNPHTVVYMDEHRVHLDIEKTGPKFEHHERFPKRINTEFATGTRQAYGQHACVGTGFRGRRSPVVREHAQ